jgi:DNA polymerase-3 subunit epsilon
MNTANRSANTVIVLDFETSGLSPDQGDRAIEIGAVLIENGRVTDRFQQLMNPGIRINTFIENYTGISNAMLDTAPAVADVMAEFSKFIAGHNLVAHNASFDQRFLRAELKRIRTPCVNLFSCSMLVARRLYQLAPNHTLGGLVDYKKIPTDGVFHRALADAEMTAKLWLAMLDDIAQIHQLTDFSFAAMQQLSAIPKQSVTRFFKQVANTINR